MLVLCLVPECSPCATGIIASQSDHSISTLHLVCQTSTQFFDVIDHAEGAGRRPLQPLRASADSYSGATLNLHWHSFLATSFMSLIWRSSHRFRRSCLRPLTFVFRNVGSWQRLYSASHTRTETLLSSRLNVPSTFPPPLKVLPPRKTDEYRIAYAYKFGKCYLDFYKTGFKQILSNRHVAKQIRASHPDHPLLRNIPGSAVNHRTGELVRPVIANSQSGQQHLTRAEFQLIRRHAKDIKKVPVMALLLGIFGEWLPLFVVFLGPLIPGTMLLPKQILKRRRQATLYYGQNSALLKSQPSETVAQALVGSTDPLHPLEGEGIHDRQQVKTRARRYGLLGLVSQFLPTPMILQRLRRQEAYIACDDRLLARDWIGQEHVEQLLESELDAALEERGCWVEGQSYGDNSKVLEKWVKGQKLD